MAYQLFDVTGRLALVTGSYRGLGNTLSRGLARAGARLVLNGRNAEGVEKEVQAFRKEGFEAFGYPFDTTDEEAVTRQVERIEREVGPIDILVNNAGIQHRAPLEDFPADRFRQLLEVNLTGAFIVAKAVAKGMIERKRGKIINICSMQSELGRATIAPYAAAKGGLKMLTRGMTVDWAKYNIQINGLGPGYFLSEMTRPLKENQAFDTWITGRTPAGRWGDPEELVGALIFLSSDASSFVNGQIVYVDGGILAAI